MIFITILLALGLQWFVAGFASFSHDERVAKWYAALDKRLTEHAIFGSNRWRVFCPLILSVVLVAIVNAIIYSVFHLAGCFVFDLLALLYCLNYASLRHVKVDSATDLSVFFVSAFTDVFALLFWYAILGVVGLALYSALGLLRNYIFLKGKADDAHDMCVTIQTVLDWVPLRLLGLSYALVGHFSPTFSQVVASFVSPAACLKTQAGDLAIAAMENDSDTPKEPASALVFLDRALLVWLVVFALVCIGGWVG